MRKRLLSGLLLSSLFVSGLANAIPVTYDVRSPYASANYSASWLHSATACNGLHASLFMCGNVKESITSGFVTGDQAGGVLTISGGQLITASHTVDITGGRIGGAFGWSVETAAHGTFEFLDLSPASVAGSPYTSSSQPNRFNTGGPSADSFVLWGQNFAAPGLSSGNVMFQNAARWGIDLYAVRVPEPSAFGLLVLGVIGLVLVRRRHAA